MWKNYRVSELTAETTDAEINAPIKEAQDALYVEVGKGARSHGLQRLLNSLAEAEGQADIARKFVYRLRPMINPETGETVREGMSREMAVLDMADDMAGTTADDTWSGRNNEIARVFHDGQRAMFGDLFRSVISYNKRFAEMVG